MWNRIVRWQIVCSTLVPSRLFLEGISFSVINAAPSKKHKKGSLTEYLRVFEINIYNIQNEDQKITEDIGGSFEALQVHWTTPTIQKAKL